MARTDTLTNFLTDVATAIKTKKGDKTTIPAANFDTEITNWPDGSETIKGIVERKIPSIIIPDGTASIGDYAFYQCDGLLYVTVPETVKYINSKAFGRCESLTTVTFKGTPTIIVSDAFDSCVMTTFNVPWAEGEVANAPWGAGDATINYNYTEI